MSRSRLIQELQFGLIENGFATEEEETVIPAFLRRLAESAVSGGSPWLSLSTPPRWRSPEIRRVACDGHLTAVALPKGTPQPPIQPGWIAVETLSGRVTIWDLISRRLISQRPGTLREMESEWETVWHHRERDETGAWVAIDGESPPVEVIGVRRSPHSDHRAGVSNPYGRIVCYRQCEEAARSDVSLLSDSALAVRWLPTPSWLLSIHFSVLRVWEMNRLPERPEGLAHRSSLESVTWSPNGQFFCVSARHEDLAIWHVDGRGERPPINGATADWGPDGRVLWIGDGTGKCRLTRFDLDRNIYSHLLSAGERIEAIACDPITGRLAVGSVGSGQISLSVWHAAAPGRFPWNRAPRLRCQWSVERRGSQLDALAWQPASGNLLAASINGLAMLFSGECGGVVKSLQGRGWKNPLIRLSGATIVAEESIPKGDLFGNLPTADILAWRSDGKWLATASLYGNLNVWSTEQEAAVFSWQVGEAGDCPFHALAWIPGSYWLVTGSADGWLRIWNGATGDCVAGCACGGAVKAVWCDPVHRGNLRVVVELAIGGRFFPLVLTFAFREPKSVLPRQTAESIIASLPS